MENPADKAMLILYHPVSDVLDQEKIMGSNQRQFPRQQIAVDVELGFMNDNVSTYVTHDVSKGGLMLIVDEPSRFPIGDMVTLKYSDPMNEYRMSEKEGIVVRHTRNGVAVAFIEMTEF
jgi:hypothetical protein